MKTRTTIFKRLFNTVAGFTRQIGIVQREIKSHQSSQIVDESQVPGIRETLDAVYAANPESSRIDPRIARLQIRSLPEDDW